MICAIHLIMTDEEVPAETIVGGHAVCKNHAYGLHDAGAEAVAMEKQYEYAHNWYLNEVVVF